MQSLVDNVPTTSAGVAAAESAAVTACRRRALSRATSAAARRSARSSAWAHSPTIVSTNERASESNSCGSAKNATKNPNRPRVGSGRAHSERHSVYAKTSRRSGYSSSAASRSRSQRLDPVRAASGPGSGASMGTSTQVLRASFGA